MLMMAHTLSAMRKEAKEYMEGERHGAMKMAA